MHVSHFLTPFQKEWGVAELVTMKTAEPEHICKDDVRVEQLQNVLVAGISADESHLI